MFRLSCFGYRSYTVILDFGTAFLFYPRPGLFLGRAPAKKFFKKFFYARVEKRAVFRYIRYVTDNTDTGPLSKPYIGYAAGFASKIRTAYAINNGKYGRIEISVNSESNMIEPGTYAITLELYNGDRRIIIGSSRLSGRRIYIIEAAVNAVLYKRRIREMMKFEEFCNANNNIPKGILKIPARLV